MILMKRMLWLALLAALVLAGCAREGDATEEETAMGLPAYVQITQQEAKNRMDTEDVLVLDVRRQDEFDAGHIPGAVLLPVETITAETAAATIPEKDTQVLVYCRSGNRSKQACDLLAKLGYTDLYEFGGINTWPYEVE